MASLGEGGANYFPGGGGGQLPPPPRYIVKKGTVIYGSESNVYLERE